MGRETTQPVGDPFLSRLSRQLKPVDDWGSFRLGARPAAVTAVVYKRDGAWHVPFVQRRRDQRSHPGQVALPGGTVNPGEDAWAAAAREVEEEIGVPAAGLEPLGAGPPVYAAVSNFSVASFAAHLAEPPAHFTPDRGELEGILEIPLANLLDRLLDGRGGALDRPALPMAGSERLGPDRADPGRPAALVQSCAGGRACRAPALRSRAGSSSRAAAAASPAAPAPAMTTLPAAAQAPDPSPPRGRATGARAQARSRRSAPRRPRSRG